MSASEALAVPALGHGAANVGNLFRPLSDDESWAVSYTHLTLPTILLV